jgi:2-polyprenyl-6-hydroxyphenyl methylase / 3-demethylubiquinone-9 3-methyltransferase
VEYKYHSFLDNRSIEDAKDIFKQRLDDATYIYNKYKKEFVTRSCPYCGSDKFVNIDKFHNMFGVDKCTVCNSTFSNPVPNIEAISDYYENCKCNRQLSQVIKKRYSDNDFINDHRVQLIFSQIDKLINYQKKISILEVGCNNGAFLSKLNQALQYKYNECLFELSGVDIDVDAINNPVDSGLNLFHGLAEDIADSHTNNYDLIIHFELIEHLIDPTLFVQSIYKMLNNKGIMVFTTPNILGLDNQALGYNNIRYLAHAIFPPMHLNAFSTQNIAHFLIINDFMVDEIQTPGMFDMDMLNHCMENIGDSLFKDIACLDMNTRALMQKFLVRMGVSSHMQCVATKKP